MILAETVFSQIAVAINPILSKSGFIQDKKASHSVAFGRKYISYSYEAERIRLVWDVRERWFILEHLSSETKPYSLSWSDLGIEKFDPDEADQTRVNEIVANFSNALSKYLK